MNKAIADVAAERLRQVQDEGWDADHDDEHDDGSLAAAAASYAWPIYLCAQGQIDSDTPISWPASWNWEWWKPKDRRRDLVRAAALIIAEIERLDRSSSESEGGHVG